MIISGKSGNIAHTIGELTFCIVPEFSTIVEQDIVNIMFKTITGFVLMQFNI